MDGEVITHNIPKSETPSEGVIKTIAILEDREPTTLDPRLYTVIDPDHLDQLFRPIGQAGSRGDGRVEFEYLGYEVSVHSTGTIQVRPLSPPTEKAA